MGGGPCNRTELLQNPSSLRAIGQKVAFDPTNRRLSIIAILERAAEALYEFVFSGCDRLDGNHRWADCDEETEEGFRREAGAVLDAIRPLYREIKSWELDRRAN